MFPPWFGISLYRLRWVALLSVFPLPWPLIVCYWNEAGYWTFPLIECFCEKFWNTQKHWLHVMKEVNVFMTSWWLHQLHWKGNWYGQKWLKVLLQFPFLFSAAGAFGQALWQDCKYHWNWSWIPMLIESNLYLSTCALKLWKQMLSAVQKHSDKFMRSLVHKNGYKITWRERVLHHP